MNNITVVMIKELRQRTGVGMSKCKDALVRSGGSIEKAIDLLRKEGTASAVKKEGRIAKDGFIGFMENDDRIALVEINCETDFVAQNSEFQNFLKNIKEQVLQERPSSLEDLLQKKFILDETVSVEEAKNILIQKFGEKIEIKRMKIIEKKKGSSYGIYSHANGKIVTIVEVNGLEEKAFAKEIAMHTAASRPEYLSSKDVDAKTLEKEKEIARAQIKNKPENIIEKIVEGKLSAFYDSACLLRQKYVKEPSLSIEQYVEKYSLEKGKKLQVTNFWYWKVGQ